MERSATRTVTETLAVLFAGVGSAVVELMLTVLVMMVPSAVAASTWTTTVKVAVLPLPMFAERVQVLVPVPPTGGFTQFQVPVPPVIAAETKVVLAGVVIVNTGLLAVFGPLFLTVTV